MIQLIITNKALGTECDVYTFAWGTE